MKKICIIIDVIIIAVVLFQYAIKFYPDIYREKLPGRLEVAVESGDMDYLERQFAKDAEISVYINEDRFIYRYGYILEKLEEQIPVGVTSVKYVPSESAYKVVYRETGSGEEKVLYITMRVAQVNFFQVKIAGMSVRL